MTEIAEIPVWVVCVASSFTVALGMVVWALRDSLAQEERTSSKLSNECVDLRAEIRMWEAATSVVCEKAEALEGDLRKSFDHIELAKLERDEANDDFTMLDDLTSQVVGIMEVNVSMACLQRDTALRLYKELKVSTADQIELAKLERDEARDLAQTYAEQLPLFIRPAKRKALRA